MNKLYRKLAGINMKNNRQFYLPYLLVGILSAAMFYTIVAMNKNPGLMQMAGGENVKIILGLGISVIGLFSSIFLFYTNSFIIKRRKKELGVYNILGMEKRHLAKVLFLETLFTAAVCVGGGLAFGIAFNKLLGMLLYRLTGLDESIPFYISKDACLMTAVLFGIVYLAALAFNLMQIKLANPIELLHGGNTGEKEPKTKILMTVIGILCLGSGYYIAMTTTNAMQALTLFFLAVILVICGTYCLFTAGSIAFLKLLRKNKNYYYQTKHFTTVSGMIYRMKQNAVGLANICILSTMVLVTVSTTVSMYLGIDDELDVRFPAEISATAYYTQIPEQTDDIYQLIAESIKRSGRTVTGQCGYRNIGLTVIRQGKEIRTFANNIDDYNTLDVASLIIMPKADYETYSGDQITELKDGEVAIASTPGFEDKTVLLEGKEYAVKAAYPLSEQEDGYNTVAVGSSYYLIVKDEQAFEQLYQELSVQMGKAQSQLSIRFKMQFDIDGTGEEKLAAESDMRNAVAGWTGQNAGEGKIIRDVYLEARQESYDTFYVLYGGLFFLGLFLGTMFLMVTVLIIFYKQISEGYEDKERFAIMEKVGMSNAEVKRAIRSQILTVFFLPIIVAAIHVAAAFPMIRKILFTLNLINTSLFVGCLIGTVLVFGLIYLIVFVLTSRSYYKIVGNQV